MILCCPRPTSGRHAKPPDCRCFPFLRKGLTLGSGPFQSRSRLSRPFACSRLSRASGPVADQREARGCNGLCGPFRLHPLEEFVFGALHGESSFGVGLELSEAIQFRQCHLWL
jgi:hypothetical protein